MTCCYYIAGPASPKHLTSTLIDFQLMIRRAEMSTLHLLGALVPCGRCINCQDFGCNIASLQDLGNSTNQFLTSQYKCSMDAHLFCSDWDSREIYVGEKHHGKRPALILQHERYLASRLQRYKYKESTILAPSRNIGFYADLCCQTS